MERVLDVSNLEPCEPMERSLAAMRTLACGDHLRILMRQEPFPLYDLIASGDYKHLTTPGSPHAFEVFVWRAGDAKAEAAVAQATAT